MKAENVSTPRARGKWRDFGYYTLRWTIALCVISAIYYGEESANPSKDYFWQGKLLQLLIGIGVGAICSMLLILLQNGLNTQLRKALSWAYTVGTIIAGTLLFALVIRRLL